MVPVPRPGLGTLAVDQHWRLYYDDAALERMGVEQAAGVILHELDHLLKRHHKRGGVLVGEDGAKWDTWNDATDASINGPLRSEGIPLPDGLIYPERFNLPDGLSADEYFRALSENQQDKEQGNEGSETSDDDSNGGDQTDSPSDQQGDGSDEESQDAVAGEAGDHALILVNGADHVLEGAIDDLSPLFGI